MNQLTIKIIMTKCILIYDDDDEILFLCRAILAKENYRVETMSRCEDVNTLLEETAKQVQPEKDCEIWVSPSPIVWGKIIREKGHYAFHKVMEPVRVPGCMVQDVEEFPRIGLLHGGVSSEASTKIDLSKRQRTPWSGNCSRVIGEEIVLSPCHLAQATLSAPSKKVR